MLKPWPYPLPLDGLKSFTHPNASHEFAEPMQDGPNTYAANGFAVIRCRRGQWIDSEMAPLEGKARRRIEKLPWGRLELLFNEQGWRPMDHAKRALFAREVVPIWNQGRLVKSPIWRIGHQCARLSLLQQIYRLPACEVFLGHSDHRAPVFFRFSGGEGMLPQGVSPQEPTFSIFKPQFCPIHGYELNPRNFNR